MNFGLLSGGEGRGRGIRVTIVGVVGTMAGREATGANGDWVKGRTRVEVGAGRVAGEVRNTAKKGGFVDDVGVVVGAVSFGFGRGMGLEEGGVSE